MSRPLATATARHGAIRPPVVQPSTGNNIIINPIQRLNPVLECIRNAGKEFGDIVADFQVGRTTGVLFLSLKYHRLHPEYIHQRIEKLGHLYSLRILLILCDISEHQDPIRELTKICLVNNITIIVAWSPDGVGHCLATFKQYEHKPPDMIKERVDKDYHSVLRTALTSISKVNKTDVETLRTALGSFADIGKATSDELQNLPGFGQVKVKKIKDAFEKPFRNNTTKSLPFTTSQIPPHAQDIGPATSVPKGGKGKEKAVTFSSTSKRLPREPSLVWDIELDSDGSPLPISEMGPPLTRSVPPTDLSSNGSKSTAINNRARRSPSPIWDIELDLNAGD